MLRINCLDSPVVEIVSQLSIAWLEHQVILDKTVLHDLDHVEHVKVVLLGLDKQVAHQQLHAIGIVTLREVVVGVGSVDLIVVGVVEHGGV